VTRLQEQAEALHDPRAESLVSSISSESFSIFQSLKLSRQRHSDPQCCFQTHPSSFQRDWDLKLERTEHTANQILACRDSHLVLSSWKIWGAFVSTLGESVGEHDSVVLNVAGLDWCVS
jgi:hypothetical protein